MIARFIRNSLLCHWSRFGFRFRFFCFDTRRATAKKSSVECIESAEQCAVTMQTHQRNHICFFLFLFTKTRRRSRGYDDNSSRTSSSTSSSKIKIRWMTTKELQNYSEHATSINALLPMSNVSLSLFDLVWYWSQIEHFSEPEKCPITHKCSTFEWRLFANTTFQWPNNTHNHSDYSITMKISSIRYFRK